jgi:hypothetical protein
MITVRELIEQLQTCNPEAIILISSEPPAVKFLTGLHICPAGNPSNAAWQIVLESKS